MGKTHFALTAPEPIRYINVDMGVLELLGKFPDLDIEVATHNMTEDNDPATYQKLLREMQKDWIWALQNTPGGTVVLDTGTQVWQVVQRVFLDEIMEKRRKKARDPEDAKLFPFDYGVCNSWMSGFLRRAVQQSDANVIMIHRVTEIWNAQGAPTGQFVFQGFKEVPYIVQMSVQLRSRKLVGKEADDAGRNFEVITRIESCRFDKGLEGLDIPNADFATLAGVLG